MPYFSLIHRSPIHPVVTYSLSAKTDSDRQFGNNIAINGNQSSIPVIGGFDQITIQSEDSKFLLDPARVVYLGRWAIRNLRQSADRRAGIVTRR